MKEVRFHSDIGSEVHARKSTIGRQGTAENRSLMQGTRFIVGARNVALDVTLLNVAVGVTLTSGPLLVLFVSTSFLAAVTNSYCWSRRWTFRAPWGSQFAGFIATNVVGLLINGSVVYFVTALPYSLLVPSAVLRVDEARSSPSGLRRHGISTPTDISCFAPCRGQAPAMLDRAVVMESKASHRRRDL